MDSFERNLILTSGSHSELGNLFFGNLPLREELIVLSGSSDEFSSLRFLEGATTLIIGGEILQIFNLNTYTVSGILEPPTLQSNNITDFSD